MDRNEAVIEYLMDCPQIRDNPLFFNFLNAKDDNKQFLTTANDKAVDRSFIDGSVLREFTFTIVDYRSIAYQAVVKDTGYPNENVEEFLDVQGMIDWIEDQEQLKNYPDFGTGYEVQEIKALTDSPRLNGVDTSISPALAKYSISIQIDYLDTTKRIWN